MPPPRRPSYPDKRELPEASTYREMENPTHERVLEAIKTGAPIDPREFENWTAKELSIRAINATLALAQEVGRFATIVATIETRLNSDFEDTKTRELRSLRVKAKTSDAREKWFKGIMTAVVTALAVAEMLRLFGLAPHGG